MKFKNVSESDYIKLFDLIQKKDKSLKIFLFTGQVGSGKTTMIKSFTKKLSVNNNTSSPTFNIINEYKDDNKNSIYHLDLYRLKSINDLVEIGFEEYINSGNYCFIEWPEIADSFFVDKYISINISINSKNSRDIDITFH
tara:strand:+ start:3844 stop:4263 length:420 start_codon:yes stop_codon:yes gene_type:complete